VFKAIHNASGFFMAIKCVTLTKTELQELQKEIEILKRCKDVHIVKYYGSYLKEDTLWVCGTLPFVH
jgi:serine/threonine protein kinase